MGVEENHKDGRERKEPDEASRFLERLEGESGTSVTAGTFGMTSLFEGQPKMFNALAAQYGEVLDQALEERVFKVDHRISEKLRDIADDLGFLKAGPRDVVQLHSTVLKMKTTEVTPQKARAYISEGRVMVLELMGYLTSYYRQRAN